MAVAGAAVSAGEPGLVELLQVHSALSAEPVREAEPGEGWTSNDHPGLPLKVLWFLFSLAIVALAEYAASLSLPLWRAWLRCARSIRGSNAAPLGVGLSRSLTR